MAPTVGVVLSGCGYLDGAEIQESVCTLLALDRAGATVRCFAPDVELDVLDHLTGQPTGERRNVLREAARITRGQVRDLREARADELDALVLPGGFGAAKNLSTFATEGGQCSIDEDLLALLRDVHAAGKPIGAICIAPALVAKALGREGPELTIGHDRGTAAALEELGCTHRDCPVDDYVVDRELRIVTTPAYMLGPSVAPVATGIDKCVREVLALVRR
ncbi:MAG: isoprenoid biosynthesis glyoxalase ElbB [Planctomycetota bacterium]